jgi:hypothetical protein
LSRAFWTDAEKQRQWSAFAARNRLEVPELGMVSQRLADFLAEPIAAAFTQKVQQ